MKLWHKAGAARWSLLVLSVLALAALVVMPLRTVSAQTRPSTAVPPPDCPSCSQQVAVAPPTQAQMAAEWEAKTPIGKVYIQPYQSGQTPTFYDANFQKISSEQLRSQIMALPKDNQSALDLVVLQPQVYDYSNSEIRPLDGWGWGFPLGRYYIRVSFEKHPIYACIQKDVWHLGFMIKDTSVWPERMIVNEHACVWWQNGPQFGLFNSANQWCVTTRGVWTAIRDRFYGALAVVGVTGWIGYIIADVSADIVVAVFAL